MRNQSKIFQLEINKERFDYVLFIILTCALSLVNLKGFTLAPDIEHDWNSLGFSYDTSIPLALAIPIDLFYIGLAIWIFYRRKIKFGKKQLLMTSIFVILACYRISTYFLFPTTVDFIVPNPFETGITYSITYSNYALVDRCIECVAEVLFLFHLYMIAMVFPTLHKDKKEIITKAILIIFSIVAIFMTLYSIIFERELLINNFYDFIGKPGYTFQNVVSITSHRNVFGFFLTFGVIAQIIYLFKKPNFASVLIIIYLTLFTVLTHSRTSICICFLLSFLTLITFIILNLKKHPIISSTFILILLAIIVLLILMFTVFKDESLVENFLNKLKGFLDLTTINNRIDHVSTSMTLLAYYPYFFWVGFGRVPFMSIYHQYLVDINYEPNTVTSHNGYIETFFLQGTAMGILYYIFYIVIFAIIIYLFIKRDKSLGVSYMLAGLGLAIHSIFESRALFIFDSTAPLFMLLFLYPLIYDFSYYRYNEKDIINNRRYELLVDKIS